MIEDIKLIERMDKLLEVGEDPEFTAEQNLSLVMGAVRGIKNNAKRRIEEFEKEYAPKENA
jgi:hypothetical protein|tara:strand:- start:303 stop:485 length:183 start_codon:yes stop_codon:yes gene_type:complete